MYSRIATAVTAVALLTLMLSSCAPTTEVEVAATATPKVEAPATETPKVEQDDTPAPEPSRPVVIGFAQEPDNLNHVFGQSQAASSATHFVYRALYVINDQGEFVPVLLEETPSVKNGMIKLLPDGKVEITYKFKEGLVWADGVEITVDDYIFTHELIMDPNLPAKNRQAHQDIEKLEAKDKYTLVLTYSKPLSFAEIAAGEFLEPKHYLEPILEEYEKKGGNYGIEFVQDDRVAHFPLGNGPYKVEEWIPGDHVTFVKNENYNLGPVAKVDKIIIRFVSDLNTLATMVMTGEVDVTGMIGLGLEQALRIEEANIPNMEVYYLPMWNTELFQLYHDKPPLSDVRVRQALVYAIDREELVDTIFRGKYQVAWGYFPESHPNFNPDAKRYPYDPDKAKELLAEAGYKPGPDGKLVDENGEKLKILYQTTAGNTERERTQQIVKAYWEAIGIEVEIKNENSKTFFGDTFRKLDTPGQVMEWATQNNPLDRGNVRGAGEPVATKENNWANLSINLHRFMDEEYVAAGKALEGAIDPEERTQLQREIQVLHMEKLPLIPLFHKPKIVTAITGLKNFKPEGFYIGWNCEEWELAE